MLLAAAGCELVVTGWHHPAAGGAYVLTTPSDVGSPCPGENVSRGAA